MTSSTCCFLGENNTRCAVGMFCSNDDESIKKLQAMDRMACALKDIDPVHFYEALQFNLDDVLIPEARNLPWGFWADLQTIHDNEMLWGYDGLNDDGKAVVERLKALWPIA